MLCYTEAYVGSNRWWHGNFASHAINKDKELKLAKILYKMGNINYYIVDNRSRLTPKDNLSTHTIVMTSKLSADRYTLK